MRSFKEDVEIVKDLSVGETGYVFWFEEGGGKVVRTEQGYELSEITQYGTGEHFYGSFKVGDEEDLVKIAHTWT